MFPTTVTLSCTMGQRPSLEVYRSLPWRQSYQKNVTSGGARLLMLEILEMKKNGKAVYFFLLKVTMIFFAWLESWSWASWTNISQISKGYPYGSGYILCIALAAGAIFSGILPAHCDKTDDWPLMSRPNASNDSFVCYQDLLGYVGLENTCEPPLKKHYKIKILISTSYSA